jgi:hypothetical protein
MILQLSQAPAARGDALVPTLGDGYFPIGVFYQPAIPLATTSFAGWKGRGVNTLVGYESQGGPAAGGVSIEDYTTAAANAGMYLIRQPSADPTQDTNSHIIGWLQPDEPDLKGITPTALQATYNQLQGANAYLISQGVISTPRPVLTNFAGAFMTSYGLGRPWVGWGASPLGTPGTSNYIPYPTYVQGAVAASDWVAQDIYPVTGFGLPNLLGAVGDATTNLINYTTVGGGAAKPAFSYIETSNQRLFANSDPTLLVRGPTPSEMRAEIWDSIIHGARGIMYFPQELDGFQYDATPIDNALEMTKQNAAITGIARALNSSVTPDFSTVTFDNGAMEYIVKKVNGVTYLIALNLSNLPLSTTFSMDPGLSIGDLTLLSDNSLVPNLGDNSFNDVFGPYDVKIYAEGPGIGTGNLLSIPEPACLAVLAAFPLLLRPRRRNVASTVSSSD